MEFIGLEPVEAGEMVDHLEVEELGLVDLRNDADFTGFLVSVEPTALRVRLDFAMSGTYTGGTLSLLFHDAQLLSVEPAEDVSPADASVFEGLEYWEGEGSGFAVTTGVAHLLFRAVSMQAVFH